jgi:hypothetical protein
MIRNDDTPFGSIGRMADLCFMICPFWKIIRVYFRREFDVASFHIVTTVVFRIRTPNAAVSVLRVSESAAKKQELRMDAC